MKQLGATSDCKRHEYFVNWQLNENGNAVPTGTATYFECGDVRQLSRQEIDWALLPPSEKEL